MARFLRQDRTLTWTLAFAAVMGWLHGCRAPEPEAAAPGPTELTTVQLQLDWFPEPAHGGFYQAVARGHYAEAGLAVEILPGGPGGRAIAKVASGQVAFSMGRSDDIMLAAQQGLPVLIVAGFMQHDPQALLLHADHPVNDFADLDGHTIMAYPGSAWIVYLKKRFRIEFDLQPMSFGLAGFIADPNLIQACFITDEPFRLREKGVAIKTLLLADAGYDPYRVIVVHQPFAQAHPAVVRAFVEASIRGWRHYLNVDPAPAHRRIAAVNEHMSAAQMAYSHAAMKRQGFVAGDPAAGESIGALDLARLQEHARLLHQLGVLENPLPTEAYATLRFLPPPAEK